MQRCSLDGDLDFRHVGFRRYDWETQLFSSVARCMTKRDVSKLIDEWTVRGFTFRGRRAAQGHQAGTHFPLSRSGRWPSASRTFSSAIRPNLPPHNMVRSPRPLVSQTAGIYSWWARPVGARTLMDPESHSHALAGANSEASRSRGSRCLWIYFFSFFLNFFENKAGRCRGVSGSINNIIRGHTVAWRTAYQDSFSQRLTGSGLLTDKVFIMTIHPKKKKMKIWIQIIGAY